MKFICLLWYVKHLLIWSLISNIYKFILIYIIMIVFSCAKSLLVYLSRVYWLPRLLQMLRHLGKLCFPCTGRASTWSGRKNEQGGNTSCVCSQKSVSPGLLKVKFLRVSFPFPRLFPHFLDALKRYYIKHHTCPPLLWVWTFWGIQGLISRPERMGTHCIMLEKGMYREKTMWTWRFHF